MKKKIPHTYVIIFSIIVLAAILTWIIPSGEFERETKVIDGKERTLVVDNSFHYVEANPQSWQVFSALFDGFVRQAGIIVFILMIGGAFWIMNTSKAIDIGIISFLKYAKRLEKFALFKKIGVQPLIITLIMLVFSIFGAVFGMSEETIAFIIILVPMAISMGYDSIVGVSMVFVAAGLGFAGALLNPFTIGIAQGIADLPLFSGIEYRLFCWLVINVVGIAWVLRYAAKIKKKPQKSLVYQDDEYWREKQSETDIEQIKYYTPKSAWLSYAMISIGLILFSANFPQSTLSVGQAEQSIPIIPICTALFIVSSIFLLRKSVHFFILNILLFTILFLIIGVMGHGWYITEIATLFFAMGVFCGMAMNFSANKITEQFITGVKDILSAALVVGLAGGIIIILENGRVIDTILFQVSEAMYGFGNIATVGMMYVIQNIINIIIPSGSAKAALTMPVMAPFSDLIGLSRQATVMAFQFGDGFTNMITPTSGVLIGVLGVAKIPYDKWVKWILPLMIVFIILGFLLLIPTVTMNLKGF